MKMETVYTVVLAPDIRVACWSRGLSPGVRVPLSLRHQRVKGDPLTSRQEGPIPLTSPYSVCRTLVAPGKEAVGRQPVFGEQEAPGKVLSEEWKLPRSMLGSSRTLKALVTCVSWSKVNEHLFFSPSLPGLKLCYQTAIEESSRKLKRMTLYSLHIKVAVLV